MERRMALCLLSVAPASLISRTQTPAMGSLFLKESHIELINYHEVPMETRLKWTTAIAEDILRSPKFDCKRYVRDFLYILQADGSIKNLAETSSLSQELQLREYPARYQIPGSILERIDDIEEKIKRTELFALGSISYELISGNRLFPDANEEEGGREEIQNAYLGGRFPDNVWELDKAIRILACWCPNFAKDLLERKANEPLRARLGAFISEHPILFGVQVAGGVVGIASLAVVPVLGLLGFSAIGPVGGSMAACWQASLGLVQGGGVFAWCQSAAMGGTAVTGILATGLTGAGAAVGAIVVGALDDIKNDAKLPPLKESFLNAWERDLGEVREEKEELLEL